MAKILLLILKPLALAMVVLERGILQRDGPLDSLLGSCNYKVSVRMCTLFLTMSSAGVSAGAVIMLFTVSLAQGNVQYEASAN